MDYSCVIAAIYISPATRVTGLAVLAPRLRTAKEEIKSTKGRTLSLFQFTDEDGFVWLHSLLNCRSVTHIYFADTLPAGDMKRLESLFGEDEYPAGEAPHVEKVSRNAFSGAAAETSAGLSRLHGEMIYAVEENDLALKAAACVIAKGKLLTVAAAGGGDDDEGAAAGADGSSFSSSAAAGAADPLAGTIEVKLESLDVFMRLDSAAVRALNLLPERREVAAPVSSSTAATASAAAAAAATSPSGRSDAIVPGSVNSLYSLLSYHAGRGGQRVLRHWMLQPLNNVESISLRQDLVAAFHESATLRRGWKEKVPKTDIAALCARLQRKTASLTDLVRFKQLLNSIPNVMELLCGYDGPPERKGDLEVYVDALRLTLKELEGFLELYRVNVDDSGRDPRIREDRDESLGEAAEAAREAESNLRAYVDECKSDWSDDIAPEDLKYEADRAKGHVFRVAKRHEKAVRGIGGATIASVLKDGIYFYTSELRSLGDDLDEAEAGYASASRALVDELIKESRGYIPLLEATAAILAELDALASMASMVAGMSGTFVRPVMRPMGEGDLVIIGGRHPVIEMGLEDGKPFIPNDYIMRREVGRLQIITGPNMGGKSTYIRTLGVISVMAQMGCFVPAESAEMPVFDCIAARVGAGDKASKGMSTFMAEMLEAAGILRGATPKSLVIVDELGRGTSTYDGFGLAWAICEHLAHTTRCMTLFATHFHELTALAKTSPAISNRHVTAHTTADSIVMLYGVREGACPASFGIHVAELAAFPPSVLAAAREKAAELEATSGGASSLMEASLSRSASSSSSSSSSAAVGGDVSPGGGGLLLHTPAASPNGSNSSAEASPTQVAPHASSSSDAAAVAKRFVAALAAEEGFALLEGDAKRRRLGELVAEAQAGSEAALA